MKSFQSVLVFGFCVFALIQSSSSFPTNDSDEYDYGFGLDGSDEEGSYWDIFDSIGNLFNGIFGGVNYDSDEEKEKPVLTCKNCTVHVSCPSCGSSTESTKSPTISSAIPSAEPTTKAPASSTSGTSAAPVPSSSGPPDNSVQPSADSGGMGKGP